MWILNNNNTTLYFTTVSWEAFLECYKCICSRKWQTRAQLFNIQLLCHLIWPKYIAEITNISHSYAMFECKMEIIKFSLWSYYFTCAWMSSICFFFVCWLNFLGFTEIKGFSLLCLVLFFFSACLLFHSLSISCTHSHTHTIVLTLSIISPPSSFVQCTMQI